MNRLQFQLLTLVIVTCELLGLVYLFSTPCGAQNGQVRQLLPSETNLLRTAWKERANAMTHWDEVDNAVRKNHNMPPSVGHFDETFTFAVLDATDSTVASDAESK